MRDGEVQGPRTHDFPERKEAEQVRTRRHAQQAAGHEQEERVEAPLRVAVLHVAHGVHEVHRADGRDEQGHDVGEHVEIAAEREHVQRGQEQDGGGAPSGLHAVLAEPDRHDGAEHGQQHVHGPAHVEFRQGREHPAHAGAELELVEDRGDQRQARLRGHAEDHAQGRKDDHGPAHGRGDAFHALAPRRGGIEQDRAQDAHVVDRAHEARRDERRRDERLSGVHAGHDHEVLAHEAVERRQAHDGHDADAHAAHGPRHFVDQPREVGELAAAHAEDEAARAEEEQVLHDRVVQNVRQRARRRQPRAEAEDGEDFTDLPHRGVGEHALDVLLPEGHPFAVGHRAQAHDRDHQAGDGEAAVGAGFSQPVVAEQPEVDHHHAEHAHLGEHAGQGRGHGGRRGGVGVGQPAVQRHETGLGRDAEEGEHQREPEHVLGARGQVGEDFAVLREVAADHEEAHDHQVGRAAAQHDVLDGRVARLGGAFPRHQREGRPGHDLPLRGQRADVVGGHDVEQRAEGQEQEEPVPVLAPVLFDVVGRVTGHQRADARNDQREEPRQGRQIGHADDREGGGEQREGVGGPVPGPDDAGAEDEEGAHIEQERGHMPRAFEFHERVGIDADEPRAEVLHQKTAQSQRHEQAEQHVEADGRRCAAPAVGNEGAPAPGGDAHQLGFPVEQGVGEGSAAQRDFRTDGLVGPGEADLKDDFGGQPQQHRIPGGHDDREDRPAEGHVHAVHRHRVQDQMLAFRRHGRGNAERSLQRERQQHGPHRVPVQRAADVVGDAGIRIGDQPREADPRRETGDRVIDHDHDAAHVAGRSQTKAHEREPEVHQPSPEDQQAGTAPLAIHFVHPKQHYQQAGDKNDHLGWRSRRYATVHAPLLA